MTRIKRPSAQFPDGAADVARRFGITIKTLRLYESAGLLAPVRDAHGWRTYGQAECERLHVILLLRRFGLTIARIGALLDEGAPDVAAVLDLQEQALIDQRNRVEDSLILIAHARRKLRAGGTIDATALADLARAEPLRLRWTPALEALGARVFTPAQQRRLADVAPTIAAEWAELYVALDTLVDGAPDTPEARALGARAAALIARMTGDDGGLHAALTQFWQDGFADPALAASLPLDRRRWLFLGEAMAAYARDGDSK